MGIEKVTEALKNCADELENEIDRRYGEAKTHPSISGKYERDIETVHEARDALPIAQRLEAALPKVVEALEEAGIRLHQAVAYMPQMHQTTLALAREQVHEALSTLEEAEGA